MAASVIFAHGCDVETAVQDFKAVKQLHNQEGFNQTVRLLQSWSPEESKLKTPEEFNKIGREWVESLFPGHQYVIRTHTDKAHTHNHIVVNTIHEETGSRIRNEKLDDKTGRRPS